MHAHSEKAMCVKSGVVCGKIYGITLLINYQQLKNYLFILWFFPQKGRVGHFGAFRGPEAGDQTSAGHAVLPQSDGDLSLRCGGPCVGAACRQPFAFWRQL